MSLSQRIYALGRPPDGIGAADLAPLMQLEAAHVWSLYEQGIARDAWLRTDAPGAVYVLESTMLEAEYVLREQPLVRAGLLDVELVPVGPFTPLATLFGTQPQPVAPCRLSAAAPARTQRVLAVERAPAGATGADLATRLVEGARDAWSLWKAGAIRESYLRTDRPGAVIVLEAAGIDEAGAWLRRLAPVGAGLVEFDCMTVGAFTGYDALLDGDVTV